MTRFIPALLALAFALVVTTQAEANGNARLKPVILVDGQDITFGDLFDRAGRAAGKVFAAAPLPGERAAYRPQAVQALAQQAGIVWEPDPGLRAVVVERAGRTVPREEILQKLATALDLRDAGGEQAILLPGNVNLFVAVNVRPEVAVEDLDYDRQAQRFQATLVAPAGSPDAQRLRIQGRVQLVTEVPVLRQPVSAGQVIGASDIEWIGVPSSRLGVNAVTDAAEMIGQAARRSLPPGRPVRQADLQRPTMIAKGALVSMAVSAPNMQLSTMGRALESGAKGDVIQIMNMQSKRTVSGTVIGPNQVEVGALRVLSQLN